MGESAQWKPAGSTVWPDLSTTRKNCVRFFLRICPSPRLAAFSFILFVGICMYYKPTQLTPKQFFSDKKNSVTILIWTHPFGQYRELPDCQKLFQIRGCTLTDNSSFYPEADAVIIHHREIALNSVDLPPEPRPRAQKWIWMNYESPSHTPNLWLYEGIFNLTMSYKTDADIFLPYGYLIPLAGTTNAPHFAPPLSRPSYSKRIRYRFVAWVISNWSESHARVALFHQLRRYIHVDVFGSAGHPLPSGADSVVKLIGGYMFYLALENSQHTDYLTEKVWNAVEAGAVPVVLGPSRKNYERFLPPEAFIHVDDFPSVEKLAEYLLMLRRNPAMMKKHLDWRGGYALHQPFFWDEHYCKACSMVKKTKGKTKIVKQLSKWFES